MQKLDYKKLKAKYLLGLPLTAEEQQAIEILNIKK